MIDHVSVAVRDLEASTRFYDAVLAALGFARLETRAATVGFGKTYPEFWINLREEMAPAAAGSGAHRTTPSLMRTRAGRRRRGGASRRGRRGG